jgi:predicted ferric reductase
MVFGFRYLVLCVCVCARACARVCVRACMERISGFYMKNFTFTGGRTVLASELQVCILHITIEIIHSFSYPVGQYAFDNGCHKYCNKLSTIKYNGPNICLVKYTYYMA